jgi:TctA family transporter
LDLSGLALGLETALQPSNILICLLGVTLGTMVGVLPGIGPTATVALLLPITFNFDPIASLIMLAGIYYGAQYGGSTTAILINLPGESSAAVTALDGYQMARQGRAGPALATAALGSFFAGTVATAVVALFAPPMAWWRSSSARPTTSHSSYSAWSFPLRSPAARRPRRWR